MGDSRTISYVRTVVNPWDKKRGEKMYSTNTSTTKQVCAIIGADFSVKFIETMKRGDKIYVRGTLGKPEEYNWLWQKCLQHRNQGLVWGHDPQKFYAVVNSLDTWRDW
jgi:hypothetical protein